MWFFCGAAIFEAKESGLGSQVSQLWAEWGGIRSYHSEKMPFKHQCLYWGNIYGTYNCGIHTGVIECLYCLYGYILCLYWGLLEHNCGTYMENPWNIVKHRQGHLKIHFP